MSTSDSPSVLDDPTPREDSELLERLTALQAEADEVETRLSEAQEQIDEILRGAPADTTDGKVHDS